MLKICHLSICSDTYLHKKVIYYNNEFRISIVVDVESYKKHLRKIDLRSSVTITTKQLRVTARKVGQKRGWKAITSLTKRHMVVVRYTKNAVGKKVRRIRLDVVQWNSVQKNVNLNRTILSHCQSYLQIQDNLYYNRIKCLDGF